MSGCCCLKLLTWRMPHLFDDTCTDEAGRVVATAVLKVVETWLSPLEWGLCWFLISAFGRFLPLWLIICGAGIVLLGVQFALVLSTVVSCCPFLRLAGLQLQQLKLVLQNKLDLNSEYLGLSSSCCCSLVVFLSPKSLVSSICSISFPYPL